MKNYLFISLALFLGVAANAQGNLKLTLDWNGTMNRYEVYALPSFSQNNYPLGKSQVSVVLPKASPDVKLNVVSHVGGVWSDKVFLASPSGASALDFHGVTTNGGAVNLVANTRVLLFSFTEADGGCRDGVRLYNNGGDPVSSTAGFNNIDFSNSVLGSSNVQLYDTNFLNTGSKCLDCPANLKLPSLVKKTD